MRDSDLPGLQDKYTKGPIQVVKVLAQAERQKGRAQLISYKVLSKVTGRPVKTSIRWLYEARAQGLVISHNESKGGRVKGGARNVALYKLSPAGRSLAGLAAAKNSPAKSAGSSAAGTLRGSESDMDPGRSTGS